MWSSSNIIRQQKWLNIKHLRSVCNGCNFLCLSWLWYKDFISATTSYFNIVSPCPRKTQISCWPDSQSSLTQLLVHKVHRMYFWKPGDTRKTNSPFPHCQGIRIKLRLYITIRVAVWELNAMQQQIFSAVPACRVGGCNLRRNGRGYVRKSFHVCELSVATDQKDVILCFRCSQIYLSCYSVVSGPPT